MLRQTRTDWPLIATILAMVAGGLLFVCSASTVVAEVKFEEESYYFLLRQAFAAGLALVVMMLLWRADYRKLQTPAWAFSALGVVVTLLGIAYVFGVRHRWIPLGITQFQPSEFAKPALIVFLAFFLTQRAQKINSRHTVLPAALALAMVAGTVVVADLGTAVVLVATAAAVFYVAGLKRRYFLIAGLASMVLVAAAIASKPYRVKRVIDFVDREYKYLQYVDPDRVIKKYAESGMAPRDTNYQAYQSTIAVGSGGWFGVGLMDGRQKLLYLPEAHTDFIYAVVGEELGLLGTTLVLGAFVFIMYRGLRLYWIALDDFGRYLVVGVAASITVQALMNMSVVLDMAPTKGIPLPLISYGGSSLLSTLTSLGLLLSVSERAG